MRYLPNTPQNQRAMLDTIGVRTVEDLLTRIPAKARLSRPLALLPALAESDLIRHMRGLAAKDADADTFTCFLGGGAYDHYVPSPINHMVLRGEYLTAYTPYQPEASQGTLRTIYEYQTMIAELTGMDVANASHLRRRLVAGRGRADGPRDQRTPRAGAGRRRQPALSPRGRDLRRRSRVEAARRALAGRRAGPRRRPARGGRQDRRAGGPVARTSTAAWKTSPPRPSWRMRPARCWSWSAIR